MKWSGHQTPADRNSDIFDLASTHRRAAMQDHVALFLPIVDLDYDSGWRAGRDLMTLAENERCRANLSNPQTIAVELKVKLNARRIPISPLNSHG
jgi:hypothetical protein